MSNLEIIILTMLNSQDNNFEISNIPNNNLKKIT